MDGIIRRRGMVEGEPIPEWDYEWDYTKGLPQNNGWNVSTSGSTSETLASTRLETGAANSAYRYYSPSGASVSKGVMEVVFNTAQPFNGNYQQMCQFRIGNSTYCLFMVVTGNKCLRFWNNSSVANATPVYTALQDRTYYKVRIVLNESVGEIYVNDTKVATVDTTTTTYKGGTRWGVQSTGNAKAYWQSVKVKLGRL